MEESNKSDLRFRALVENNDGIISLVDENLNVLFHSSSATRITGWTHEEYEKIAATEYLHPDDEATVKYIISEAILHPGKSIPITTRVKHKNGNYIWMEGRVTNMIHDKNVNGIVINLRDITKRTEAEEKIIKINRLYHFISQINQMIVRVTDEEILFSEACHIAVRSGNFRAAWIGIINKKTKLLEPVMYEGESEDCFSTLKIKVDEDFPKKNTSVIAGLLTGKTIYCNDTETDTAMKPWKISSKKHNYLSVISIPINKRGKVIGSFNLYTDTKNFFDNEEIEFLERATEDISFALDIFEKEALRKKAEQAVLESGRRYQTLAEMSPVGIFHTDATGFTTYVNPRWCEISGMSFNEALGNGWLNAVHEDDKEKLKAGWFEAAKDQQLSASEYRFVRSDGIVAWVMGQAVPEINSENEVVGFIGTITDITGRKISEEEIKRSNIQLSLSQRIAHIGYWELDLVNSANYWSEEMYRLVRLDNDQMPMDLDTYLQNVHPDDREIVLNAHRLVQENKGQLHIEFRYILHNGTIRNFFSIGNLITGKNGEMLRLVGITQDITERKKIENEILKEKQLSDSIINSLPGAFYLYTREGKFLRWNKNFEKITKYSPEEIRTMHPTDFFDEDEKELLAAKIANTFITGEDHVEANLLIKTKEKIPYYFTGIAIDYEGDTCLMGVGIDISERIVAQEKIKQTSDQLRHLALHLQTIREEERKRIGREIHDELGQQLTAIKMDVAWIDKKTPEKTKDIKNKLKNIIELLDGSNKSIRRILSELRSGILDDHDLLGAIEWLGKQFTASTGVPVRFSFPGKGIKVSVPVANCIFRLYQEAFTNITRYAHANEVLVAIQVPDGK
ncbi:MAG: PAS domain S-box protein, partial [Bacteroidota bacterium]|nr:PAS domain S-box protein [Bacteroidota bacterium]